MTEPMITAEQMKKALVDRLYWDARVDASGIQVEVKNGIVTLRGDVPNDLALHAAEEDAGQIQGVRLVDNQLAVQYPSNLYIPSDKELASFIQTVMACNPHLHSCGIRITVENGQVLLEGAVDAYWKKGLARQTAGQVTGVIRTTDQLAVVPSETVADEVIAQSILKALSHHGQVDVNDLSVQMEQGKVSISGSVPSWPAHRDVLLTIHRTVGVVGVVDNLVVEAA